MGNTAYIIITIPKAKSALGIVIYFYICENKSKRQKLFEN